MYMYIVLLLSYRCKLLYGLEPPVF